MYNDSWIDFNKNGKKDVYEDPNSSDEERAEDLLLRMTVEEKTCQLTTLYGYNAVLTDQLPSEEWKSKIWKDGIGNIDEQLTGFRHKDDLSNVFPHSLHAENINTIQRWFIEETRLGIPVDFTSEGIRGLNHYKSTFFPAQIGVGSTWDKDLVYRIGEITAKEAKALGYTNVYSPILDLARDPRWGRTVETYGEEPYLVSQLGKQQVIALQGNGVMSTVKHFCVYGVPIGGRDGACRTHPQVTENDMFTLHMEPFRVAIGEADAWGAMASYNDYNGIPVAASHYLLTQILRKKYGLKGYVVSDSDAVEYIFTKHKTAVSYEEGIGLWLAAGGNVRTTFTPPEDYILPMRKGIEEKTIAMKDVDIRVKEVLIAKFMMGLFDQPYVEDSKASDQLVACEEHKAVAKEAALKSIVLLKNDTLENRPFLPLKKDFGKVAVIGPMANETEALTSRYGPVLPDIITVKEGIERLVGKENVSYTLGANFKDPNFPESDVLKTPPQGDDQEMIDIACAMARENDVVVLCLGDDHKTVGESMSRYSLGFSGYQQELLEALTWTGTPVVLVMLNGRPVTCNWAEEHAAAIIEAWFPGEFTGEAVAEVLFGEYNPGGRLSVTFPKSVGQIPLAFPYRPGGDDFGYARVNGPVYPFGYGLSYTSFEYNNLEIIVSDKNVLNPIVTVSCTVENIGDLAGDEVVQLYLNDEVSSTITYKKVLRGFERIHLSPSESKTVHFELDIRDLGFYNQNLDFISEPGTFKVWISSSSVDDRLEGEFQL